MYYETCSYRVRTDLEKSLNLTLSLKTPGIWKKKLPFVLELSWNFVKNLWRYELVFEKYKNTTSPFRFMGCAEKLCENRKKTEWKSLDTRQRARCNSYSILFNLCGSPGFYHRCQDQINRVRLFIPTFLAKKSAFSRCFIQNWEEIESLKNEKVLEKSWNSVFPFPNEPCLNTMFCLLLVSCLVIELFCSYTHDRYANSMLY